MRKGLSLIVLLMLTPAHASAAGIVAIDGDGFATFTAGANDVNSLTVSATVTSSGSATVVFTDSGATLSSTDCDVAGANTVTCTGQLAGWSADLGAMNDSLSVSGNFEGGLFGGDGNDVITGSETNELQEFLDGGDGDDQVLGRGGDDFAVGEDGTDFVDSGPGSDVIGDAGGEGNDVLSGGAGFDTILYTDAEATANDNFRVDLLGGFGGRTNFLAENDSLAGFEDVDTAGFGTGSAADTITGSAGSNVVKSGDGVDIVNPVGGADMVFTGAGNDAIEARDGAGDRIDCAEGVDNLQADQFDEHEDCEVVGVTSTRPMGADFDPPSCTVAVKRKVMRRAFRRGLTPRVSCNEAATVRLELRAKLGLLARAGDVVLAEATTQAGARVRLRPPRRLVRRLPRRRAFRVRLVADVRDPAGNRSLLEQRVRVRKLRARGRR